MIRSYSEMARLPTFEERYEYLALRGAVGQATFGFDRWLNQQFYTSRSWRQLRLQIIARDNACDLAVDGYEIHSRLVIHHLNPLSVHDLVEESGSALDPENLVSTTHDTHNAIHYGDRRLLRQVGPPREPGDTTPWNRRS